MKKIIGLAVLLVIGTQTSYASKDVKASYASKDIKRYYAKHLCSNPEYYCIKVKSGQNWQRLFPDPVQRDIVQRINRTNMHIWAGRTIAVPHNLANITMLDVSPFPLKVNSKGNKMIMVDQEKLAWGAYNRKGELVKWGPISSGKDYCSDVKRACITQAGIFQIFHKKDKRCQSNIFPVGRGGADMPYCMFFYRGFALHGSREVPGYRDSHGCVRLFTRDAKWLNESFVDIPNKENNYLGTVVVVQKLITYRKKGNGKKK